MFYIEYECITFTMLLLSCSGAIISQAFTAPLLWPHEIVKCPMEVHFRILLEMVGHCSFRLLLYKNCEFRHSTCLI